MKIEEKSKFRVITPEEGCKLTAYKEEDDITTYESCATVYQPLAQDPTIYRDVTLEEDAEYQAAKEAEIEARQKAAEELEDATDEVAEE